MEKIQHYFLDQDIQYEEVDPGVSRKIIAHHDALMICHLHFEKGAEFNIGGEKMIIGPGDSTYKEPHIVHGAVCLEEGELLDIFTPERKDFLK